jgi:hypothetical protein
MTTIAETHIDKLNSLYNLVHEQAEEISSLRSRVALLESNSAEQVIVLRTITREDAKAEIAALFERGETLYFSDIVEQLSIDLEMVVDICKELEDEGVIGVDANSI